MGTLGPLGAVTDTETIKEPNKELSKETNKTSRKESEVEAAKEPETESYESAAMAKRAFGLGLPDTQQEGIKQNTEQTPGSSNAQATEKSTEDGGKEAGEPTPLDSNLAGIRVRTKPVSSFVVLVKLKLE